MSVVRHDADFVDENFLVLADARHVRPKLGFVGDNRTPVFGAENDVNQGLDVGVGQWVVLQGGYCNGHVPRRWRSGILGRLVPMVTSLSRLHHRLTYCRAAGAWCRVCF